MKLNVARKEEPIFTHEGARAVKIDAERELQRSVMACMLWEDSFYESGQDIAARIAALIPQCRPEFCAAVAAHARWDMKLRHVPLLVVREMARLPLHKGLVAKLLPDVIGRPDEITEFLAIYWREKRQPLSAQVKKGLAAAFRKFKEYDLAKYNRDGAVKLRDALFLSHAKPDGATVRYTKTERRGKTEYDLSEGEQLYKKLVDGTLETPDTWEVALSGGADKKEAFTRLMAEKKLGALAFIRNLRNMEQAGVTKAAVAAYGATVNIERVLPFRFVAAARACPQWEDIADSMLLRCTTQDRKISGKTVLIVDISGSMYGHGNISKRSDMTRVDAAGALAAIVREQCEDSRIYATAGNDAARVHATAPMPPRRGMALVDVIAKRELASTLGGGGIFLAQCLEWVKAREHAAERIIVITDEQDCDVKLNPDTADAFGQRNYLINISVEKNGIGYKHKWVHIDGWSEAVIEYIGASETQE